MFFTLHVRETKTQELSGGCVNVVVSRKEFALVFSRLKNGMKPAFVCLFIKCGFKTLLESTATEVMQLRSQSQVLIKTK